MKALVCAGSFAFLIILMLGCGSLHAQEDDTGAQDSARSAPEPAASEPPASESATENGATNGGDPLARFNEKTLDEQQNMIGRAHEGMNKLTPAEQQELEAAQKDYLSNMSPQQAAQEMRDALSNMTPEQQDAMRAQWEQQVHADPRFSRLSPEEQRRVLDRVKSFGKEGSPDIVTKDQGN